MQTLGRDKGTMTTTSSIYRPRFPRNDQQEDAYRELSRDFTLLVDAISLSLSPHKWKGLFAEDSNRNRNK